MAESVDALVSNTSGATRAGSTPALGTDKNANDFISKSLAFLFYEFWRLLHQHFPGFSH